MLAQPTRDSLHKPQVLREPESENSATQSLMIFPSPQRSLYKEQEHKFFNASCCSFLVEVGFDNLAASEATLAEFEGSSRLLFQISFETCTDQPRDQVGC